MIPKIITEEARQFKAECQSYINNPDWVKNAASYFLDVARRDSQRSVAAIAKDKWSYLQYRANTTANVFGHEIYIDKPAREKYLAILSLPKEG